MLLSLSVALLLLAPAHAAKDGDGDGVLDSVDACPAMTEDLDGFQDSDGCPDPDNDLDSVPDTEDKCPTVPEDRDGYEDADGCPDVDNDADGLTDVEDPCPDQAGPRGCPAETDAVLVPFSKLTTAIAGEDVDSAQHAFHSEAWDTNLVGSSGLSGSAVYAQAARSRWSLVPTEPPLMVGPDVALVPCSVQLITSGKELDRVVAVVALTEAGWRILGAGENPDQVRALASSRAQQAPDPDAVP